MTTLPALISVTPSSLPVMRTSVSKRLSSQDEQQVCDFPERVVPGSRGAPKAAAEGPVGEYALAEREGGAAVRLLVEKGEEWLGRPTGRFWAIAEGFLVEAAF